MTGSSEASRLDELRAHGRDAVSFQALESGISWWHDARTPEGTGGVVPYRRAGRSWIAVGSPLVEEAGRPEAARRFARAAAASGCRAVFFGVEDVAPFAGFNRLLLGLQSELDSGLWPATLRRSPKLREQLRRARAKGVTVRLVTPGEFASGGVLRQEIDRLRDEWLGSRAMEPLGFLVAVEPFHAPGEHLYVVAEREGKPIQFLSAVPVYVRRGWLMEDMLRGVAAPNGTTELVIDRLMRELGDGIDCVTPGLTPLAGNIPWWLRGVRMVTTPLYDFDGLRRFRARLSPPRWRSIWLVWNRGFAPFVLLDVLRAFAGGSVAAFAMRSLVRHPNGPPWAVAVPLVAWTILLVWLLASGRSAMVGFSGRALAAWIVFDAVLAALLFRAARRPRPRALGVMMGAAAIDAIFSVRHLAVIGLGTGYPAMVLRVAATCGPIVGTAALAWALRLARGVEAARARARAAYRGGVPPAH